MTDAKPVPDAPGGTPPATLTAKQIHEMVGAVACDGSTAGAIASALVSRFEHLQAEVARLTQNISAGERRIATLCEAHEEAFIRAEAAEARLTAQAAALEELEQEIRDYGGPNSIMEKWADRLAALRTPEVKT